MSSQRLQISVPDRKRGTAARLRGSSSALTAATPSGRRMIPYCSVPFQPTRARNLSDDVSEVQDQTPTRTLCSGARGASGWNGASYGQAQRRSTAGRTISRLLEAIALRCPYSSCIGICLAGHDRRLSLSLISTTWSASCSRYVCALCAFEIAGGFARESILTVRHPRMCLTAPSDPARQQFLP